MAYQPSGTAIAEASMSDLDLKDMILDALDFDPSIDAAEIGVTVESGVVTLHGHVRTYTEKTTAEQITMRVKGVRALAQEIEVRPIGVNPTADDEVARRILDTLRWNTAVPSDAIQVKVTKGWVTLTGTVEWNYHREAAERAIRGLSGVVGVSNAIVIAAKATPVDVRDRIEKALRRDAELQAAAIRVQVSDGTVTLEGDVHSLSERQIAERAAWAAPGVRRVEDRLQVR
jgi:osmotically-inducible protein OsmY